MDKIIVIGDEGYGDTVTRVGDKQAAYDFLVELAANSMLLEALEKKHAPYDLDDDVAQCAYIEESVEIPTEKMFILNGDNYGALKLLELVDLAEVGPEIVLDKQELKKDLEAAVAQGDLERLRSFCWRSYELGSQLDLIVYAAVINSSPILKAAVLDMLPGEVEKMEQQDKRSDRNIRDGVRARLRELDPASKLLEKWDAEAAQDTEV